MLFIWSELLSCRLFRLRYFPDFTLSPQAYAGIVFVLSKSSWPLPLKSLTTRYSWSSFHLVRRYGTYVAEMASLNNLRSISTSSLSSPWVLKFAESGVFHERIPTFCRLGRGQMGARGEASAMPKRKPSYLFREWNPDYPAPSHSLYWVTRVLSTDRL